MPVIIYKSNDYLNFIIGGLKSVRENRDFYTDTLFVPMFKSAL